VNVRSTLVIFTVRVIIAATISNTREKRT